MTARAAADNAFPPLDVVIPTWNGRHLLEGCLRALAAQTIACSVIVADNGSTDGTIELVREASPAARLVELGENLGFGPAVNRGVAAGAAPFVVLVNNDVHCDPSFLERLAAPFEESPQIGMVAGLLLRPGRMVVDSYGLELDRTLAAFPRFAGEPYHPERLDESGLFAPSGGAAAYRRRAFESVGGFDERLFAYMEDVDLGLRLQGAGWRCAGAPEALGVHERSATAGRRSRRQVEIAGASRGYMLRKYGVLRLGLRSAGMALAAEAAAVGAETLLGRDLAALRGRIAGWHRGAGVTGEVPDGVVDDTIGLIGSLRRRRASL
ncbi:MAG: glycosyltransferase family 2 protein [Actinobacteria bacterium]|nr:glycosyltransferase family 2 protein [Actinomycetota bacterium]